MLFVQRLQILESITTEYYSFINSIILSITVMAFADYRDPIPKVWCQLNLVAFHTDIHKRKLKGSAVMTSANKNW